MAEICESLTAAISDPTTDKIDALTRQARVLDELLHAFMRKSMAGDLRRGYFDDDNLAMALRIQRQCVETLKAASQIEYMKKLNAAPIKHAPHPPFIEERNE